ncbi:MAG: ribonuclease E inhibitor RraB [Fidelibacterota bacterium]
MDIDKKVLDHLYQMESHSDKPHDIDFFFYFPTEETAQLAAGVLKKEGFDVEVHPPLEGYNNWSCNAYKTMLLEHAELADLRKWFNTIAEELGGSYDGWGTMVQEL